MPLIVKSPRAGLLAFRLGSAVALRETESVIDQLQTRVRELQAQLHQAETEKAVLSRKLCETRLEIALREQRDLLARADSPSQLMH